MARTTSPRTGGQLMARVSRLPWWSALLLAPVLYALLHLQAGRSPAFNGSAAPAGAAEVHSVSRSLAGVGQYLLPSLCIVGALASAWRRRRRTGSAEGVTDIDPAREIEHLSRREFQTLVAKALRLQGYQIIETGADGNIDFLVRKERETSVVLCRHWKVPKVGVESICALYALMKARGASGGIVLTSGRFSREAIAFAGGSNIQLVDGRVLQGLLARARSAP